VYSCDGAAVVKNCSSVNDTVCGGKYSSLFTCLTHAYASDHCMFASQDIWVTLTSLCISLKLSLSELLSPNLWSVDLAVRSVKSLYFLT